MLLDEIRSNRKMFCAHCGDKITPENYSGWEVFVEIGNVTQPACKFCLVELSEAGPKSPEYDCAVCA